MSYTLPPTGYPGRGSRIDLVHAKRLVCIHRSAYVIPSFGTRFSPVKFSAQGHSTSELLRTLLMSGCF